jgi:uncharacterized protein YdcH (DUF465 family)
MTIEEIEYEIASNNITAAKVFTLMEQRLTAKDRLIERLRAENKELNEACNSIEWP